jgi:hypothetical protein
MVTAGVLLPGSVTVPPRRAPVEEMLVAALFVTAGDPAVV